MANLGISVSADAKQASATFKELADDIKSVGKESVGVTDGVAKVGAALERLKNAPDTPMALARATAKVKLEVDELRAALDKTPASAEKMKAISAALAQADAAMQKSIERAGKLGEAQEETKQKMGLTAKGAESLGNSFGSLDGIMGKMADSSSGVSQGIAKIGFSVVAAGQAFKFGYETGEMFRKGLTAIGVQLPDLSDKFANVVVGIENLVRGYKAAELVEGPAVKRARELIAAKAAQAKAEQDAAEAIRAAIPGWESMKSQQTGIAKAIDLASAALTQVTKAGGDWRKEVEANQKPLADLVKRIEEKKVALDTLPAPLQEAIKYLKELEEAAKGAVPGLGDLATALQGIGKGDVVASIEAVAQALKLIGLSGGDVGKAVATNIDALMALRTAAEGNYDALAKFRTEVMDQIPAYQATAIAMQGYAGTLESITAATAAYEAQRRAANEADIAAGVAMAEFQANATKTAYAIDSIGEAWAKATGQAAGFTVEVRRATKTVEEADPKFTAFIESLAGVSDEYERMIPYVGALIAQLESGKISTEEFGQAIDNMRVGFMQIQGVSGQMFGDIDTLFNRLRELVNSFTYDENPRNKR